jgi:hypothetical protein
MTRVQTIRHLRARADAIRSGRSIETRGFVGDAIDAYLSALDSERPLDAFTDATALTPRRADLLQHMQDVLAVLDALYECERELDRAKD